MPLTKPRNCLYCGEEIEGRSDKLFCNTHCKSLYHYDKKKNQNRSLYKQIDLQLKQNRKLLKHYNQAGKTTLRKDVLIRAGFNPNFFTHYWKNQKGQVYLFCYEYGFLSIKERGIDKYLLVEWQEYMEK